MNPAGNPYDGTYGSEGVHIVNGHIEKYDMNLKLKGMKTDIEIEVEKLLKDDLPRKNSKKKFSNFNRELSPEKSPRERPVTVQAIPVLNLANDKWFSNSPNNKHDLSKIEEQSFQVSKKDES